MEHSVYSVFLPCNSLLSICLDYEPCLSLRDLHALEHTQSSPRVIRGSKPPPPKLEQLQIYLAGFCDQAYTLTSWNCLILEGLDFPVAEIGLITSHPHAWRVQMRDTGIPEHSGQDLNYCKGLLAS